MSIIVIKEVEGVKKTIWQRCKTWLAKKISHYGNICYLHDGIPQNYEKAILYYEMAALLGYRPAMCALGLFYAKDNEQAMHWFEKLTGFTEIAEVQEVLTQNLQRRDDGVYILEV